MKSVIVRVPASTSNLGPGFDCLGVALRIYNWITVRRDGSRRSHSEMVDDAAALFFKQSRVRPFRFASEIRGDVPQSRGLGSSVTVRLGILHGLNQLAAGKLDRLALFRLCAELEGHPDNAAPASLGGFTVARSGANVPFSSGKRDACPALQRFGVSARLKFVLLVPGYEVSTEKARRLLPHKIDLAKAVETCGYACAVTAAFASRSYENLRGAFVDHLHQPFRRKLNPLMQRAIVAAEEAGALGAWLSGSGSTICAVTVGDPYRVARAMHGVAKSAQIIVTLADNRGVSLKVRNPKSEIRN